MHILKRVFNKQTIKTLPKIKNYQLLTIQGLTQKQYVHDNSKIQYQALGLKRNNIEEINDDDLDDYHHQMAQNHAGTLKKEEAHFNENHSINKVKKKFNSNNITDWLPSEYEYHYEMSQLQAFRS
jgi:hypothetical protein